MDLPEALAAQSGLVCVVGAGGKKSTMYALAERIDRAVVTATVRIPIFDPHVSRVVVTEDPVSAVRSTEDWPIGVVPEREREDRYRGYERPVVDDLAAAVAERDLAESVLVKADGARMREFKAPDDREPRIPTGATTVLPVASVQVVGRELDDSVVHRPDRVAAVAGLNLGEEIRPEHVAAVLASDDGGRKDVPEGASVVPVINKVDDEKWAAVGREIASEVLDRTDRSAVPRVALTQLTDEDPLVDVVS